MTTYLIRSTHRDEANGFFVAFHSYTPFFSDRAKAKRFGDREVAATYARTELFTEDAAFGIVEAE